MSESELDRLIASLVREPPLEPTPVDVLRRRAADRRRTRRVGVAIGSAIAVVVVGVLVVVALAGSDHGRPSVKVDVGRTPPSSTTFKGQGTLIWAADDGLHVLRGDGTAASRIAGSAGATRPALSPDGRWVAWLSIHGSNTSLWLAPTGRGQSPARRLVTNVGGWAWAQRGAVLAYHGDGDSSITVLAPGSGRTYRFAAGEPAGDVSWSANGRRLAYVVTARRNGAPPTGELFVVDVADPSATRCRTTHECAGRARPVPLTMAPVDGTTQFGLELVAWVPDGSGVLFRADPYFSGSIEADGLPLLRIGLDGGAPTEVVSSVLEGSWVQWSPNGRDLLVAAGGGRFVDDPRRLVRCRDGLPPCVAISPEEMSALDPAWDSSSRRVAWAARQPARRRERWRSPAGIRSSGTQPAASSSPPATDPSRRRSRRRAAGVAVPRWSADGRHLSSCVIAPCGSSTCRTIR